QSSLQFEKHPENFSWTENCYEANRRRRNFSDEFDPNFGRPNGGRFGRKEKNGWRSQGRNGTENINHRGGYHGGGSRARTSTFHCGKGQGLHENNVPDNETGKNEDNGVPKQFEAEDFVKTCAYMYTHTCFVLFCFVLFFPGYPLNPKSRSPRMLVIKKGSTKELRISGFPVVGSLHSQPVRNGTGTSFYKGLIPKPVFPTAKVSLGYQWHEQHAEKNYAVILKVLISTLKVLLLCFQLLLSAAHSKSEWKQLFPCNRSNSSSPVDKVGQPRLTKLTRMRTDKKSEFLKALKGDRAEEEHEDKNHAGQEKVVLFIPIVDPAAERNDILMNLKKLFQELLFLQCFVVVSVFHSTVPVHMLLKEMGWQEDSENDETYAPLTEDEMREFRVISEQLRKNGLRKNGILKNGLKFSSWKNSTFKPALENEDSETSSSDTSDDDDV
ncbi:GPBP1 protein, partial [Corythaeola cristata]|nr:GPBP1 protein [Corythaeola cristata]